MLKATLAAAVLFAISFPAAAQKWSIGAGSGAFVFGDFVERRLRPATGVAWWISERFALEGNISDIATSSPFHRDDFPDVPGFNIPRPHNVHTAIGARWRF